MALSTARIHGLDSVSVDVVTHVLGFLDHPSLLNISHVARRLRDIVHQYKLPFNLRAGVLYDENATNSWLAYFRSLLERNSRIGLIFDLKSLSKYEDISHLRRLNRWEYLLCAMRDLVLLTSNPGFGGIVALVAHLPQSFAQSLFTSAAYPFPHLRELTIHGRLDNHFDGDSTIPTRFHNHWQNERELVYVPSNLFANSAPALRSVTLRNVVLPGANIPAFSATTSLSCDVISSVELRYYLMTMTNLRSLAGDIVQLEAELLDADWLNYIASGTSGMISLTHIRLGSIGGRWVDFDAADGTGRVLAKALINVRHLTLEFDPDWLFEYDPPGPLGTFAAAVLPANAIVSVKVEERDSPHVLVTANYARNAQSCSISLDFSFTSQGDTVDFLHDFFERLSEGSTIAELGLAFQDIKVVVLGLTWTTLERLKKFSLTLDEKQLQREQVPGSHGTDGTVWTWMSEMGKDDTWFCEESKGSQPGRNLAPPPHADILQIDTRTKTKPLCAVEFPSGFVDMLSLYVGFNRPIHLVLGGGLTIQEMHRYSV